MDKFELQVLQKDGTIVDYEMLNERNSNTYEILLKGKSIAKFIATEDGEWKLSDNPGEIDSDLQNRISNQLNGFRA